jgi:hypothetical protein
MCGLGAVAAPYFSPERQIWWIKPGTCGKYIAYLSKFLEDFVHDEAGQKGVRFLLQKEHGVANAAVTKAPGFCSG